MAIEDNKRAVFRKESVAWQLLHADAESTWAKQMKERFFLGNQSFPEQGDRERRPAISLVTVARVGNLHRALAHAVAALIESRPLISVDHVAFSVALLLLFSLASPARAQTPCPGSDTCPGPEAKMVCPAPGATLPGNDVTFTWCNANADYFLDIESVSGAHDIFFAFVPQQNFVHLINLPTNGVTIYVTLWTQLHGQYITNILYTYTAASPPPKLADSMPGTTGRFQFTINGVTPGKTNVVQSSLDLSSWTSISTNVAVSNSLQIIDSAASNFNLRFYQTFEMR